MVKASQIAYKAAEIMSERGHCKHLVEDDEGRVCYVGALGRAVEALGRSFSAGNFPYEEYYAVQEISHRILLSHGISPGWPIDYNNHEDITGEDVILLLKETGERLENAGS